jgi:hypothetical protein
MARRLCAMTVLALVAALVLLDSGAASGQSVIEQKESWIITNRDLERFEEVYGKIQNINLEELLNWTGPQIHGAVRTRGILFASQRPQSADPGKTGSGPGSGPPPSGPGAAAPARPSGPDAAGASATPARRYALTLPTDRPLPTGLGGKGFAIQPGILIQKQFEFEVDALNMREIEVVGTFETPVGSDRGVGGGFWFWAYAVDPTRPSRAASRTGLLAVEDIVTRPAQLARETVKVQGQFRGKNLFGDLENGNAPADGWVIKDGPFAIWVYGCRPKGRGWSLDPESRGDAKKWVQVTGRLDRKGGVPRLKAEEVELVPPPAVDAP